MAPRVGRFTASTKLSLSLTVAALIALAGPDLHAAAQAQSDPLSWNTEWVGMNLGVGAHYLGIGDDNPGHLDRLRTTLRADLLLFNLQWRRLYWTVLEVHPMVMLGFFGGGTRLGARFSLSADGRHEVRCGTYVGWDVYMFSINDALPTLSLGPHLQYVYNTGHGSVGVGVEVPINFHFQQSIQGLEYSSSVPPALIGAALYFRWTVGRTVW